MMESVYDTAIVGGGPAGCSAAIKLAEQGARVVLFEAKSYPHDKLCGEFLSPECAFLLDRLGLTATLHALNPVSIEVACLTAPDGTTWETRLPGVAWGLSRSALDAAMAGRARALGVEVRETTTVTDVRGNLHEGFEVATRSTAGRARVRARTVIAAHGKRGALDRALDRRFLDKRQPFVALKAHFNGPPLPGRIELHAFPGGYCGMSEFEGGAANICLLVRQSVFRDASKGGPVDVESFIEWIQAQNARLRDWLSQAERIDERWISVGEVPFVSKRAVVSDVLMAGDAAGLIAPLAGDGISMALRSGSLAAVGVADFLAGRLSVNGLQRRYAAQWRRAFGSRLRLARVLQGLMLRPRLLSPALRVVAAVPPLGDFIVRHTRDTRLIDQ